MNKKPLTSFGHWELVKPLGSGAFGEVHHWKNNETAQEIATKRLKANQKLMPDEVSILQKRWVKEYEWIQNLGTNFIVGAAKISDVNFLNYLNEQNNTELPLPVIVMEYCNGGDLRGHLNKIPNMNGLAEYEVRNILFALLRAIEYLHQECNIEHRDIKPENIVLHCKGKDKIYKLTDFGYAKEIPESTVAQSVVGTRNYVAPEVIDSGVYTKSVDYWSIGMLAYEIICGIQPFIPHQTYYNRMINIQQKPRQCIAIVQKINDLTTDQYEFLNNILAPNHLSSIFLHKMEEWLRMALDTNYKTRGCNKNNQLRFYCDLDALAQKKIVTVFSLKTLKKYYYDIGAYDNLSDFYNKICTDNQIDIRNIFFILPPLHPKKSIQSPDDHFVPEWCDTSNSDNPPVMLFVAEYFIQNDDIVIENHFKITEAIPRCMGMTAKDVNMENTMWLLQQFERDVHFTLSECQNFLECYLMGLHNFSIDIDHAVCKYYDIDKLVQQTLQLSGSVKHSNIVLTEYCHIQRRAEPARSPKETSQLFNKKCQELEKVIVPNLRNAHKALVHKCKELATNKIYERYTKNDIFALSKYRKFLSCTHPPTERLEHAQIVFEECVREFTKFTRIEMKNVRAAVREQIQTFDILRQNVNSVLGIVSQLENELEDFTRSLIRSIIDVKSPAGMNALHIDGTNLITSLFTNQCSVNDIDLDSKTLIDECKSLCHAMEMSLN